MRRGALYAEAQRLGCNKIALTPSDSDEQPEQGRRSIPGSTAFVPTTAGLILAGEVVKDIAGVNG